MNSKEFKTLIQVEVYGPYKEARKKKRLNLLDKIWCRYVSPNANAVYLIRKMQRRYTQGKLGKLCAALIHTKLIRRYQITIPMDSVIGSGLTIPHPCSITISSKSIGNNFRVYQNTTIGIKAHLTNPPVIGNNVVLFASSSVIGDITIADNTVIGANSVVVKSTVTNGVYAGCPARLLKERCE